LAETGNFFVHGGTVVRMYRDAHGQPRLAVVKPSALCSDFELVARLVRVRETEDGEEYVPTTCSESVARRIIESAGFQEALPRIKVLSSCPVLIERNGELIQVADYDQESGILAGGEQVPDMDLADAISLLDDLVAEFRFATQGDRARALAAVITPALVFGNVLNARAPVDLGEADASQSGKGFRNKLTTAIYNTIPRTVTQRARGGVGSIQESFDSALVSGARFIALDNLRGRLDLPALESFLTEDSYPARVPYASPVEIDPRQVVIMLTSNKAEVTIDLANRSSCVRIMKQTDNHQFRSYPEGDLLDHVRANQRCYLGAVFAVVRQWHRLGKPALPQTAHDFRQWARVLGYIVERILHAGELLSGHRTAQKRVASPSLNWLRDLSLAVRRADRCGDWMRASQLLQIATEEGVQTPGIDQDADFNDDATWLRASKIIGRKISAALSDNQVVIDALRIQRRKAPDSNGREQTEYAVLVESPDVPQVVPEVIPENPEVPNYSQHFS